MAFSFRSGVHTRVGLAIMDDGGEAYLDNLRLFEKSKAIPLANNNASNPEDDKPTPEDPADPEEPADPDTPVDPDTPIDPDTPADDPDTPAEDDDADDEGGETADGKVNKDTDKDNGGLWILLVVGGVLLMGGGVFAFLWWRKKRPAEHTTET